MLLQQPLLLLVLETLWLVRAEKTSPIETPGDAPPFVAPKSLGCASVKDRCPIYCTQGPCPSIFDDELLSDGSFLQTLSFDTMGEIPNNRSYEVCSYSGDFNGAGGYRCIYNPSGQLQPFVYDPVYKDMERSYSACPKVGRTGRNFYCTDGKIYPPNAQSKECIADQATLGASCDLLSTVGSLAGIYCGGFETAKGTLLQIFNILIAKLQDVQPNQDPKDKEAAKFQTLFFLTIAAALGVAAIVVGAEAAVLVEAFGSFIELLCIAADTLQVAGSLCAYVSVSFPKECYLSESKKRSHLALDAPFLHVPYGGVAPRAENLCTIFLSQLPVTAEQCANIPDAPKCDTTAAVLLENGFNQSVSERIVVECPAAAKARKTIINACKIRQAVVDFEPYCGSLNGGVSTGTSSRPYANSTTTQSVTTDSNGVLKNVSVADLMAVTSCPPEVKDCPTRASPAGPKIDASPIYTTGAPGPAEPAYKSPYAQPEGSTYVLTASAEPTSAGNPVTTAVRSGADVVVPEITASASMVQYTGAAPALRAISNFAKSLITLIASVVVIGVFWI